jgi:hypothetical protein
MLKTLHFLFLIVVATVIPSVGFSFESASRVWTFDDEPAQSLLPEFQVRTLFDRRPAGDWKVVETEKVKNPPHASVSSRGKVGSKRTSSSWPTESTPRILS